MSGPIKAVDEVPMFRLRSVLALAAVLAAVAIAVPVHAQQRDNPFLKAKSWAFQLKNLGPEEQARIAAERAYSCKVCQHARNPLFCNDDG